MGENEICYRDATGLAELISGRQISAAEVVQAHLDRIEAVNPKVNAVVTVVAEQALAAAHAADRAMATGTATGALHGVPFTVKDSLDVAGTVTTRGSSLFRDRVPVSDATAVARLRAAAWDSSGQDESAGVLLLDRDRQLDHRQVAQPLGQCAHSRRFERRGVGRDRRRNVAARARQ